MQSDIFQYIFKRETQSFGCEYVKVSFCNGGKLVFNEESKQLSCIFSPVSTKFVTQWSIFLVTPDDDGDKGGRASWIACTFHFFQCLSAPFLVCCMVPSDFAESAFIYPRRHMIFLFKEVLTHSNFSLRAAATAAAGQSTLEMSRWLIKDFIFLQILKNIKLLLFT